MSTPIVKISSAADGESHIIVDAGYAESLRQHINKQGISVGPAEEALSRTVRIYLSKDRRLVREEEPIDYTFDAKAKPEVIEKLVGGWLGTIK
jgi:hypothetical protein